MIYVDYVGLEAKENEKERKRPELGTIMLAAL
jgi:hypothetical protein